MSTYHCRACNTRITVEGLGETRNPCAWCHAGGRDVSARMRALLESCAATGSIDIAAVAHDDGVAIHELRNAGLVSIANNAASLTNEARNLLREVDRFSKFGR